MPFINNKAAASANATMIDRATWLNDDKEVGDNATDTISSIRWSPVSNYLATSSWDGKVRVYDIADDLTAKPLALIASDNNTPLMSCDWTKVSD